MKQTKLKVIAHIDCKDSTCPTIYRSEDGRFYVQGFDVPTKLKRQVNVPNEENLVEVPKSLLRSLISNAEELL